MTPYELRFHPDYPADVDDAAFWYELEAGLGSEFVEESRAALHRIARGPHKYQRVLNEVRRAALRRFPYAIYFEIVSGNRVLVYALASARREPFFWATRLTE